MMSRATVLASMMLGYILAATAAGLQPAGKGWLEVPAKDLADMATLIDTDCAGNHWQPLGQSGGMTVDYCPYSWLHEPNGLVTLQTRYQSPSETLMLEQGFDCAVNRHTLLVVARFTPAGRLTALKVRNADEAKAALQPLGDDFSQLLHQLACQLSSQHPAGVNWE